MTDTSAWVRRRRRLETPARRPLVVCVDDDPPVLSAIRRLLRHEPYELFATPDPGEALARVGERKVDLVIADQRMPSMRGTELLKAVRERSPETVGVILTGHADLGEITEAMSAGAVDRLVKKPWDDAAFRGLIEALVTEGRDAGRPAPPPRELPARPETRRVACEDRSVDEILAELAELLRGPEAHVAVAFEGLPRARGSLTELLAGVVRSVIGSGARAVLVDPSGMAPDYLDLVGRSLPLAAYRSAEELSPPKHVLVVEDQEESLDYLLALLRSAGHGCEAATSVTEAVARLRKRRFDLVLLDLVLPDADGVDVARHVLEGGLRTPIVALSGYVDPARRGEYAGLGIRRQLSKPCRPRDILDAVRDS